MRSPAAAIAWEFRRRHRWGLLAVAAFLLVLVTVQRRLHFDDAQSFMLFVVVPLTSTFLYLLAVFTYGLTGDLAARQSMYPARMFTLPVTSAALAGWPMLYGTVTMAALWLATRLFAAWPAEVEVPVVWPALLAASLLAWTQALTWMPYPLPGLRVIVTVLWLTVIDAIVLIALELKASELVMLAILAPHVPLAYLAARHAVAKARRGDVPDWQPRFARPRERELFRSPAEAQMWFEWRRHGRTLPVWVAILLPFELALLFVFSETPVIVFEVLLVALLTPPFMAAFVGASAGDGVTPFLATRPMSDAALIAAKLKMAIRSTLAAWLPVVIAIPLAVKLSGASPVVMEWVHTTVEIFGVPRAVTLALLAFVALLAATWKQLVQSLFIGMSGREWLIKGSVFLRLSILAVILPVIDWILQSRTVLAVLWNGIPWIAAVLAVLKLASAAWVVTRLPNDRALLFRVICWDVAVFAIYGLLVWLFPMQLIRTWILALLAILMVPLARVSAAPLALAWNRHR